MDDAERPAELPIFVADRVEAMRAGRDDRPLAHPVLVQGVDRARRQHLEHVVVAHPPGGIARARLLLAEHRESRRRRRGGTSRRPGRPSGCAGRTPPHNRPSTGPRARRARRRRRRSRRSAPRTAAASSSRAADDAGWPHGLPCPSIDRNAAVSSCGKRDSSRTRLRRSPTILSTCSISTGQASTHAPQVDAVPDGVVRDRVVDDRLGHRRRRRGACRRARRSRARSASSGSGRCPCSASTDMSRMPMMKVLGLSGFPVLQAGQACWHRPHSVQVKPSRRSFQPRSWSDLSPNVAFSSSRSIFGSSPRGASLRNQMFGKLVAMWRCLLNGR